MQNDNVRKTDRRTIYTRRVIKEAYAETFKNTPVDKITVAQICKSADINRSTFYLHYSDITQLHLEIEDDIYKSIVSYINQAWTDESSRLPLSNLLHDSIQQDVVFKGICAHGMSAQLHNRVVEYSKTILVEACVRSGQLTEREAELWSIFIINGSLATSMDIQNHGWKNYKNDNAITDKLIQLASSFIDMKKINAVVKTLVCR